MQLSGTARARALMLTASVTLEEHTSPPINATEGLDAQPFSRSRKEPAPKEQGARSWEVNYAQNLQ